MPCIQVGVRIPPHLHKKLAIHAAKAEASKSEVIINAFPHYLKFTEDIPNPDWNPPIEVIRGRTSHHLWHQTSQTIYISTYNAYRLFEDELAPEVVTVVNTFLFYLNL